MLFLDKCVKTALLEEGQVLVSLDDLCISSDELNTLFEGIYEQARPYIQRYVKKEITASTSPLYLPDAVSIKRVSYNTFMNCYNRAIPDISPSSWDFDPHSRMFTTYAATTYIVEYLCYPKCGNLTVSESVTLNALGKASVKLPCKPNTNTAVITYNDTSYGIQEEDDDNYYFMDGETTIATLSKSKDTLNFEIPLANEQRIAFYSFDTLNYAIEEWDMKAEIFMVWFKAALLSMIGAIKEQAGNIDTASMPFDINRDGLLARARELYAKLDELKVTKSCWWEF